MTLLDRPNKTLFRRAMLCDQMTQAGKRNQRIFCRKHRDVFWNNYLLHLITSSSNPRSLLSNTLLAVFGLALPSHRHMHDRAWHDIVLLSSALFRGCWTTFQIWQRWNVFMIECFYYAQRWPERYYHNQVKWQQTNLPYCCPHLFFEKQFGFTMRCSVPKDNYPTIMYSQLCRDGLNISSDNSRKD